MLAQPMSSTKRTAPVSMRSAGVTSPTIASRSGTARKSSHAPIDSGNIRANSGAVWESCRAARSTVMAGYIRPATRITLAKSRLKGSA